MKNIVVFLNAVLAWTLCLTPSTAQITPDASMPGENSKVQTKQLIDEITGGATRGKTLFHSFQKFSISEGRSANFANPANINLILTRVTGGKLSNIDGTLRVLGNADLFFMNPSGIIFGPNAALDLNGSFLATTGSGFVFEDGKTFSATNPQSAPPLKISVPLGIQFSNTSKAITVESPTTYNPVTYEPSYKLKVQPGKTISLLGGNVYIRRGSDLNAPNGKIEIGSVGKDSLVTFQPISEKWSLNFEKVDNFKDIILSQWSHLSTYNYLDSLTKENIPNKGYISLTGRRIDLISSSIFGQSDIDINASESLALHHWSNINISAIGNREKTNININTKTLNINSSFIRQNYSENSTGGNININTNTLNISNGSIDTFAWENITNGKISINAKESVNISDYGGIYSSNGWYSSGSYINTGGDIEINTGSLSISESGYIHTSIDSHGKGGNIKIYSNDLSLSSGGNIYTNTYGQGEAGNTNIQVSGNVSINGQSKYAQYFPYDSIYADSGIFSTSYGATGKTGNLSLISKDIEISDGAGIGIISEGNGPTGFLNIEGDNLTLDNNAYISMKGINNRLGNLNIDIDNLLLMKDQSKITYKAEGLGIGSKVNIDAPMIIAFPNENSDIIVDAPKVDASITGKEVLGLTKRSQPTNMSDIVIDSEDDRELVGEYGRTSKLKVSEFKGILVQPKKIVKGCRPGQALGDGRFVYKRRGGIPPSPYELENAPAIWQDLRPHAVITAASLDSSNRSVTNKNLKQNIKLQQESIPQRPEIVEAQGWTRNATGQIVLTAKTAQLIAHGTEQPSAAC